MKAAFRRARSSYSAPCPFGRWSDVSPRFGETKYKIANISCMLMCTFVFHQNQKRGHFGTVAIDVHRMFHHDSTALTTRASGLGWTSAGLLLIYIQGVYRNLRTNPVDPSSPLQKLTHTILSIHIIIRVFERTGIWSGGVFVSASVWDSRN